MASRRLLEITALPARAGPRGSARRPAYGASARPLSARLKEADNLCTGVGARVGVEHRAHCRLRSLPGGVD